MFPCESPSSSDSTISEIGVCQVCGDSAHGKHFGAMTCRACSAFFRRAVLNKYKLKQIRCNGTNCGDYMDGKRIYCKKCRLQRCIGVGMTPDSFRLNLELIHSHNNYKPSKERNMMNSKTKIPTSMETFLGRPHFLISLEPEKASNMKTTIDLSLLISKAASIFTNKYKDIQNNSLYKTPDLEKMASLLDNGCNSQIEKIKMGTKFGKDELFSIWEENFLTFASWLSHFEIFQNLPDIAKLNILKCSWQMWNRLRELIYFAEKKFKKQPEDGLDLLVEADTSWCSNYDKSQLLFMLDPWQNHIIDSIVIPLMKLRTTPVEQGFMLAQLCFEYAGKLHQGSILQAGEQIQESLSNDLHRYYVEKLKMPNYSGRLAQLMGLNNLVMKDIMDRLEMKAIARLFDVFKVEFTHPEMFFQFK